MRAHLVVALLPGVALALAVTACGGATASDLLGVPPAPGPPDASASADGASSDAGSSQDMGSGATDTGTTPPLDAFAMDTAPIIDTGPPDVGPPVDPGVRCGSVYCPASTADCCATGVTGTMTYACQDPAAPSDCTNNNGIPISCDDAADCPAQVCCGTKDSLGQQYIDVSCQPDCSGTNNVTFCNPASHPDECLAAAMMCKPSTLLPGYHVCG